MFIFGVLMLSSIITAQHFEQYQPLLEIPEGRPLNILLLGKAGHGKSALGNFILGKKVFESRNSGRAVTTKVTVATEMLEHRQVSVVDTPGVIDLQVHGKKFFNFLSDAVVRKSREGYHAFLVVLSSTVRITAEEKEAIRFFKNVFGKKFFKYTIFVFTHGDSFSDDDAGDDDDDDVNRAFEKYIQSLDEDLKGFLQMASYRKLLVNSREKCMRKRRAFQVELLDTIDSEILKRNEGEAYRNKYFELAVDGLAEKFEEFYRKKSGDESWEEWVRKMLNVVVSYVAQKLHDAYPWAKCKFIGC